MTRWIGPHIRMDVSLFFSVWTDISSLWFCCGQDYVQRGFLTWETEQLSYFLGTRKSISENWKIRLIRPTLCLKGVGKMLENREVISRKPGSHFLGTSSLNSLSKVLSSDLGLSLRHETATEVPRTRSWWVPRSCRGPRSCQSWRTNGKFIS